MLWMLKSKLPYSMKIKTIILKGSMKSDCLLSKILMLDGRNVLELAMISSAAKTAKTNSCTNYMEFKSFSQLRNSQS